MEGHGERALTRAEEREIWQAIGRVDRAVAVVKAQMENLTGDINAIAEDCRTTREWVEERDRQREKHDEVQQTLSSQQKVAVTAGIFLLISTLIGTIASLASAGAFG